MSGTLNKALHFIGVVRRSPSEAIDRLMTAWESRTDRHDGRYVALSWDKFLAELSSHAGSNISALMREPAAASILRDVTNSRLELANSSISQSHSGDDRLALTCYALCRVLRPQIVLETGVAYGVTTAFILAALNENAKGHLVSIDLPPLASGADSLVGAYVPEHLRGMWSLRRGTTRRLLPSIVAELKPIDLFVHDSLHTFASIQSELSIVTPHLSPRSAVVVDDVEGNSAFAKWVGDATPKWTGVVVEARKSRLFGVALFAR